MAHISVSGLEPREAEDSLCSVQIDPEWLMNVINEAC